MSSHKKVSLSEINQSIDTPNNNHFWQNLKAFLGPGALVAVGYMDPGNWITSVVGGASYKYSLLFVILISSLITHCYAASADGRKAWNCNSNGLGSSNGSSFTQMASL